MKKRILALLLLHSLWINAQEYFPKNDGVKTTDEDFVAFTHAKIFIKPGEVIDQGTLLINKGKVLRVGKSIDIPNGAVVIDAKGKFIYPSFIDLYSSFGIKMPEVSTSSSRGSQYDSKRQGYYWNEHIMPEKETAPHFKYDTEEAERYLKLGFGILNTHVPDGIAQGTGLLLALNNSGNNNERIIESRSGQYFSFKKSKYHKQVYPTSLMGSIALLRQMYIDADWYARGKVATQDLSLEAINKNKNLLQLFDASDKGNVLRADRIADSFGLNYTILGGGNEYELVEEIKATQSTLILPLNFPKAFDVSDTFNSQYISLAEMKDWNQAPSNPAILNKNGIEFALTTHNLKKLEDFHQNLLKAIAYGLPEDAALASLTTIPAKILNKSGSIGQLTPGAQASFFISTGNVFEKDESILEHWVQGRSHKISASDHHQITGEYKMNLDNTEYLLKISESKSKLSSKISKDGGDLNSKIEYKDDWLYISFSPDTVAEKFVRLTAKVKMDKELQGVARYPDGKEGSWKAQLDKSAQSKTKKEKIHSVLPVSYPNVSFGQKELPKSETILFKGATVWTNESDGILTETDVLVKDGKIFKIGKDLKGGKARIIEAHGKHLTTGIIDEHSHIATISTNEAGQNSTAEVTMEDAINPEDINIYRNLAGGVTQAQILHGSANPIGGRSAIIKLKWGNSSDKLIDRKAPKFIKFALGENVKQSNWGGYSRFPQTRMGVEQVFVDYFQRAKEYDLNKKSGKEQRKDIELEVLAEILNEERFISCHSYVQSEINMLMKVAEQFDFKVNTFTHILEGYKVADKMREHGAGGSTFSDWWAYKYEVNDAIPYNAAIMHSQGVVTAINSDDAEMSRRLNQEAAKTMKYGGVSEEDAWKFVTLNPAKLLHIDDRLGSVKVGKEADLVLWSDHPLSVKARAEKTMIEGAIYFDIDRDLQMRSELTIEKNNLINMMLIEKENGEATRKPETKETRLNHCDTVDQ